MKIKSFAIREQISILIADPSQTVRMEIASVLRALGFSKIDTCQDISELRKSCRAQSVDWVISSLFAQDHQSLVHLLTTFTTHPTPTAITCLIDANEHSAVPRLFELGLTAYSTKVVQTDKLRSELSGFIVEVERWHQAIPLIAASYLHRYLIQTGAFPELIAFHTQMSRLFSDELRLLLLLGETKFAAKMGNDALATLRQVVSLDPSLEQDVQALTARYVGKIAKPPVEMSLLGASGLDSCLVVDSDADIARQIEPILTEFKIKKVEFVTDGNEAWERICKQPPKLLLTEWRVPGLSGAKLIQRLRAQRQTNLPVVVISSLLKKDDFALLQEMGVSGLVSKPIVKKEFLLHLNWALLQNVYPSEQTSCETKILTLLSERRTREAKGLVDAFLKTPTFSESRKKYVEAEWLYHSGNYAEAKDKAIESLKLSDRDTIATSGLLGRILLKLGDAQSAVQFFERASALSPSNLERLCQLAEASVVAGQFENATSAMENAEAIDDKNSRVQNSAAKIATACGNTKKAKQILTQTGQISPLVSFMNTQAVACVLSGDLSQGLRHYENTIHAIPDDFRDVANSVRYNMALAHARFQNSTESKAILSHLTHDEAVSQRLKAKVGSLNKKIDAACASGQKIELAAIKIQVSNDEDEFDFISLDSKNEITDKAVAAAAERPQSMFGLYRIYKSSKEHSDFAKGLV